MPFTARAMPEMTPPPPIGTTTVSTSGTWSMISSPRVPCPAITAGWSNGGMNTAPVWAAKSFAALSASSTEWPRSTTSAP